MKYRNFWMVLVGIVAVVLLAACGPSEGSHKIEPVKVTRIEGTELSSVEITERAAERIDIKTVAVREEAIVRKRSLGGKVVEGEASIVVRVALNESDLNSVDRDQPVVIRPLEGEDKAWMADVIKSPAGEEKTALYCSVPSQSGFAIDQRVFVEVSIAGGGGMKKVVPYKAVLYDTHGDAWVYTQTGPLTYVRAHIVVDYIEGDSAILSEGPPAGTEIVTDGAGELFGAEHGIGGGGGGH